MTTDIVIDQPTYRQVDQDRIRNAQKKRIAQLKAWSNYDRKMEIEMQKKRAKGINPIDLPKIRFPQNVILLESAGRGDLDEVRRLLKEGICPDVTNGDGLTALHQSCIDNNTEMCSLLLAFGANVNAKDIELWTPLHASAACGHAELCELLIDSGAELLALNADGNMPYDICEDEKTLTLIENKMALNDIQQSDIDERRRVPERIMINEVERAFKEGHDLDKLDSQGAAYIHIAAASGYADVVSNLMDHGVNIDALDKDGWKAIHVAAYWSQLEVINVLCNYGADIESRTANGETVFDICEDEELKERLNELKDEIEKMKKNNLAVNAKHGGDKTKGLIHRRNSSNPRGSSIRRSSTREKKAISWKEAREERNYFDGKYLQPNDFGNGPNSLDYRSRDPSKQDPYIPDTKINIPSTVISLHPDPPKPKVPNGLNTPPAVPPGNHRNNYSSFPPQIPTNIDGVIPNNNPRSNTNSYRESRANYGTGEKPYRPPSNAQPGINYPQTVKGNDGFTSPIPPQYNAYNQPSTMGGSGGVYNPNVRPPGRLPPMMNTPSLDLVSARPINPGSAGATGQIPRTKSTKIPNSYDNNLDEKRRMAQSGKCCTIM